MQQTVYMFPMRKADMLKEKNPYVYNLSTSISSNFNIVNYGKKIRGGILDVYRYFFKAKFFYFNWIEDISSAQAPFFVIFFYTAKIFGKKIVWTHHNREPHKKTSFISKSIINLLKNESDFIIIHTTESYAALNLSPTDKRVKYFFHPFFTETVSHKSEIDKQYDLLIWGNVRKSKGVDTFLQFLRDKKLLGEYRILVVGKFQSDDYYKVFVDSYKSPSLTIENKFISAFELENLHTVSKFVFFPYTGASVLNSGALITSLPKGIPIIGPNTGAFKEVAEKGLIYTYDTFSDVLKYLNNDFGKTSEYDSVMNEFIQKYTWNNLSNFLGKQLK